MLKNLRIVLVRPRGSGNIGSIARAMKGEPKIEEITAKKDTAKHPFSPK